MINTHGPFRFEDFMTAALIRDALGERCISTWFAIALGGWNPTSGDS